MFQLNRRITLQETDATGVLFFGQQFKIALEVFEAFLKAKGFSLHQLLDSPYLMPVVHAEADYFAPLQVDDELCIQMTQVKLGNSSVTFEYLFFKENYDNCVGQVKLVHVVVDRSTRTSVSLPDFLKNVLSKFA